MALVERDQVKWTSGAEELALEADTGESFLVKDIRVGGASGGYVTLKTGKTTVGYFRNDSGNLGNHLHHSLIDSEKKTLLGFLWDLGIFKGYPVAEGQEFLVDVGSSVPIYVLYDIYEAGDQTEEAENGSKAGEYMIVNYGRKAESGNLADGNNEYIYSKLPSEFPEFPFGNDVPAKTEIEVFGILASDVGKSSGTRAKLQRTQYLKFLKEREVLFDEDKRGLPLWGEIPSADGVNIGDGYSVAGNYSDVDRRLPLMFSKSLTFSAGEELTVIMNTNVTEGSANITVQEGEIGLIEKVRRVT